MWTIFSQILNESSNFIQGSENIVFNFYEHLSQCINLRSPIKQEEPN